MTNPNPFVPKGSLLEHQSKSRSQFKWAVSGVLAVSVVGLVAILIQGCKRETPTDTGATDLSAVTNSPDMTASNTAEVYSNATPTYTSAMPSMPSNGVSTIPPVSAMPTTPTAPPPPPPNTMPTVPPVTPVDNGAGATTEYTVVSGDTLGKIAHAHGVGLKALMAANPGVDPKKLHPKQKLNIPAPTGGATSATAPDLSSASVDSGETYVVKSGDTLTKIAKAHHVKVKALEAANGLSTTQIKVGQKLKLPASAETAPATTPATSPVPDMSTPPPSMAPATTAPAPSAPMPTTTH